MVSKINFDARSVTVEWYERNETKGKEVELDAILALNSHLCADEHETTASMPKMIKQTSSNPLSRVSYIFYRLTRISFHSCAILIDYKKDKMFK